MTEKFLKSLKKSEFSIRQVKNTVREYLSKGDNDRIAEMALLDRRNLGALISLSYDKSSEICWRAIHLAGKIIGSMAETNYDEARVQVRRLLWNASDESGTIPWSVVEIIGEVVRENPTPFEDMVPIIIGFSNSETEDNIFLPGVLYAIGRIGEKHDKYMSDYAIILVRECLRHKDSEVCANALIAAKRLKVDGIGEQLDRLRERHEVVKVYYADRLVTTTVSELAGSLFDKTA
ncbi:MAG: hypothetical protein HQK89_12225 [Nitrospirae bacterium]|nr:hypothetical protein [Nitrospirota bacterium]